MSQIHESTISFRVDPNNPGQFFACCGLLELADRLWDGAEGWFDEDGRSFHMRSVLAVSDISTAALIDKIAKCHITNTMTDAQRQRRDELSSTSEKEKAKSPSIGVEKKVLDALWREAPVLLSMPFNLRVDWFLDKRAGGANFKTWAGQQSVIDIASNMQNAIRELDWRKIRPEE